MNIEYLKWDSSFFGIKIGRVNLENELTFNPDKFQHFAKYENFDLVYLIKYKEPISYGAIMDTKLDLVDVSVTMRRRLQNDDSEKGQFSLRTSLSESELSDALKIASDTSAVSRFNKEVKIGVEKTKELYKKWVSNALLGIHSDGIFLESIKGKVVGIHMIRTDHENAIGYFTMTGVDPLHIGLGIGNRLWTQSFNYWSKMNSIVEIRSPFSICNHGSFNFHLKMGFDKVHEIRYIYHYRT